MADRPTTMFPADYPELLAGLKARIQRARIQSFSAENLDFIALYFDAGEMIVARQEREGLGRGIIACLAVDLKAAFLDVESCSPRNPWRTRAFHLTWRGARAILPQSVAELPWAHNGILLEKLSEPDARQRHAGRAIEQDLSRCG